MARYPGKIEYGAARAVLDGEHYGISFPFNADAAEMARALPGRHWDSHKKVWLVKKRWHRKIDEALREIALIIETSEAGRRTMRQIRDRAQAAEKAAREAEADEKYLRRVKEERERRAGRVLAAADDAPRIGDKITRPSGKTGVVTHVGKRFRSAALSRAHGLPADQDIVYVYSKIEVRK